MDDDAVLDIFCGTAAVGVVVLLLRVSMNAVFVMILLLFDGDMKLSVFEFVLSSAGARGAVSMCCGVLVIDEGGVVDVA